MPYPIERISCQPPPLCRGEGISAGSVYPPDVIPQPLQKTYDAKCFAGQFAMRKEQENTMKRKQYINAAIAYAVLAMLGGIFYREFTKFRGFTGQTTLAVVHTHYFMLGMLFFLLLLLLEKSLSFTDRRTEHIVSAYHAGLQLTVIMLLLRGILQVLGTPLSSGLNAAISGIAGIGHLVLGTALFLLLLKIRNCIQRQSAAA